MLCGRTHRQRTQGYIKELEKEVLRLREKEAEAQRQNEELAHKARSLEQSLIANNIPVPESLPPDGPIPFGFGLDLQTHSPFLSTDA